MINNGVVIIKEFRGEYFFLSNFYPCSVEYEGKTYQSSEAAFQAAKTTDDAEREIFTGLSPSQAKERGRSVALRDDWEDIKIQVMTDVCYAKFSQNKNLKQKLIETGDAMLEEGNDWGDKFWGCVDGYGRNHLGEILMAVRTSVQLKKCTCGGMPILKKDLYISYVGFGKSYLYYWVECSKCGKRTNHFSEMIYPSPTESAIEAWSEEE